MAELAFSNQNASLLQASSSGRITYHELSSDGKSQKESHIEFLVEDVQKLRRSLRKGTLVEFSICTDNQTKAQKAVHVNFLLISYLTQMQLCSSAITDKFYPIIIKDDFCMFSFANRL